MAFLDSVFTAAKELIQKRDLRLFLTFRFWGTPKVNQYRYFRDDEIVGLDRELVSMLDLARGKAGVPFIITSGLRSQEHNDAIPDSVKDSSHITGNAVDLLVTDSDRRFTMLKSLFEVGFTRIGIYGAHIHCDNSKTLPQGVCWYSVGT